MADDGNERTSTPTPLGGGTRRCGPSRRASANGGKGPAAVASAITRATGRGRAGGRPFGEVAEYLDAGMERLDVIAASPAMFAEHAANLADRLQQRLAEVDRREARLNSQEAEFDSRIRTARLWIEQCEGDIAERQQQLQEQTTRRRAEHCGPNGKRGGARATPARTRPAKERPRLCKSSWSWAEPSCRRSSTPWTSKPRPVELGSWSWTKPRRQYEQRQRELDGREARLYSEQERLSRDHAALGAVELQLDRRAAELTQHESGLHDFEQKLSQTASELEFRRAELDREASHHAQQAAELAAAERRLQFRQREIEAALKRMERLGVVEQKMVELEQQADELRPALQVSRQCRGDARRAADRDGRPAARTGAATTGVRKRRHAPAAIAARRRGAVADRRGAARAGSRSPRSIVGRARAVARAACRAAADNPTRIARNSPGDGRNLAATARCDRSGGTVAVHRTSAQTTRRSFSDGG